jgi:hypothetical protein
MFLIRRGPDPVHGFDYERQIFACQNGHNIERCVDFYGKQKGSPLSTE